MRIGYIVLVGLLLLTLPLNTLAGESKQTPTSLPGVKVVDADTLKKWLDAGEEVFLLDARKTSDYEDGHLPDAENLKVPLDLNVSAEAIASSVAALEGYSEIKELAKDSKVVAYCNSST